MGKWSFAALACLALVFGLVWTMSFRSTLPPLEPAEDMSAPSGQPLPPIRSSLGGAPVGEPLNTAPRHTNESLQQELERQKKAMGIKKIIIPSEEDSAPGMAIVERTGEVISQFTERLQLKKSPQALINGNTPRLEPFVDSRSQSRPVEALAPYAGAVISRAEDAETLWATADLGRPRPKVDFSKESIVIAPGPIAAIHEKAGHVVVGYKESGPEAARYAVMPKTTLPVVFERLP